jgi:hypothetical protein
MNRYFACLLFSSIFFSCTNEQNKQSDTLFKLLPAEKTGVDFTNQLDYTQEYNAYTFRNFYNGAGVGIGDINNDGLADIYLCGNLADNKLYLNKGNFQFEDITKEAGVACPNVWSTGVSLADVNGDGWLDIYVCKSGTVEGDNRHNELFINNQDGTFTESAADWGIADLGLSVHAAFFDYDKDGDLDCYLLNNSIRPVGVYDLRPNQREVRDTLGGNKLYRNEGNHFTDVSDEAGIYGSEIGFGLGVTIGDINRDGWQDIFVSNDFFEKDYLYINQGDGTFDEQLEQQITEISMGSMGADMADINNDGYPEIFVTDMLPETNARMKTKTTFENWDKYQLNLRNGYYHQFTRNVLQLNNQNGTFSEISRLAGVEATDWSWGALIADFDNDGLKDVFVANGIFKDLTDQDYINFYSDPSKVRGLIEKEGDDAIMKMIDLMPSEAISNCAFRNKGDLAFQSVAQEWGLDQPGFSNGSAYGDLDNDGDLDLVVNNVNAQAFLYKNQTTEQTDNNYLTIKLKGNGANTQALGTQVTLQIGNQLLFQELAPMRGFQSSVDQRLHFGLGASTTVDTVLIQWPDGAQTRLNTVAVNTQLEIAQPANQSVVPPEQQVNTATWLIEEVNLLPDHLMHSENNFVDFDRDRLMYHMLSREGPPIAVGDVNGDNRDDFYLGGAKGSPGQLLIQQSSGHFMKTKSPVFEQDATSEDTDAIFFDADGDGDMDLYVCSGGNEFSNTSSALKDRLYINLGNGQFEKMAQSLPTSKYESSGCVTAADYDQDGDVDLFVGIRLRPFLYGVPMNGYLLENDGDGQFTNITDSKAPELKECGLITDAVWVDYDQDQDHDLVVVGEWMPIKVFQNNSGTLTEVDAGFTNSNGLWNTIAVADIDQNNHPDLILGNHGWNSRLRANQEQPMTMYINDFDRNGTAEQIISVFNGDYSYPLVLRHDLIQQLPHLKKKYLKYENYKDQSIKDIFTEEELSNAIQLAVYNTTTSVALNNGQGQFALQPLPVEAQFSPVYAITTHDINQDGWTDLILGGNFCHSKPEIGIYNASYGLVLQGGANGFQVLSAKESGLLIRGEIRSLSTIFAAGKKRLLIGRNNDEVEMLTF